MALTLHPVAEPEAAPIGPGTAQDAPPARPEADVGAETGFAPTYAQARNDGDQEPPDPGPGEGVANPEEIAARFWRAPGPVSAAFLASAAWLRALNGPIGGGKTGTLCVDGVAKAALMAPCIDGVRRHKIMFLRETQRAIEANLLPSWFAWFPSSLGNFIGGSGGMPAAHSFAYRHPEDGGLVHVLAVFRGLGEANVEQFCKGFECSQLAINELDNMPPEVLDHGPGRAMRYPHANIRRPGASYWSGTTADFNAPDMGNWVYAKFYENDLPEGWEFYRQPSGLAPDAEGVQFLGREYYTRNSIGKSAWYLRRFIRNEPGFSLANTAVFPEFNDALHVAAVPLEPLPYIPLVVGLDAGGRPAATFWQFLPDGTVRGLREIVGAENEITGPQRFADMVAAVLAEPGYDKLPVMGWADPSAQHGNDKQRGEKVWIDIVAARAQIRVRAAPTNKVAPRLEAVRSRLMVPADGRPLLVLSPAMKVLRRAFNGGYCYADAPGADHVPDKGWFSNVMDSCQYAMLGGTDKIEADRRRAARARRAQPAQAIADYDPTRY